MGGCVLIKAALSRTWFDKIVLSAPMIDLASKHLPRGFIKGLAYFMKSVGMGGLQVPGQGSGRFRELGVPQQSLHQ